MATMCCSISSKRDHTCRRGQTITGGNGCARVCLSCHPVRVSHARHSNAINEALFARVVELSQTKSASNAMEKCLRFCTQQQRDAVADKVCWFAQR